MNGNIELVVRARNETSGAISEARVDLEALAQSAQESARSMADVTAAPIVITADDQASAAIAGVRDSVAGLPDAAPPIALTATDQTGGVIDGIRGQVAGLSDRTISVTADDNASSVLQGVQTDLDGVEAAARATAASVSGLAIDPIEITAIDSATPILDGVRARIDAGDYDVPPLDVSAVDNATPVIDDLAEKISTVAESAPPVQLQVDDAGWRKPIDDMLARLNQIGEEAAKVERALNDIDVKPMRVTAQDNFSGVIAQFRGAVGGIDGVAGTAAQALGGLNSVMSLAGAAAGVAGVVALGQAIFDLGAAGAAFSELQGASEALGESFGVNARAMLSAMREAADGTISDSALMLAANRAIVTGVTKDADTLAALLTEAKARADAFGLSSTQAFDVLVTGIGNAAPRMLRQLGYTIDAAAANEEYARSIGVAADALTEQQQRQALLNAVMAQGGKIPAVDSAADSFERLDVAMANLRDSMGALFGPAVAAVAQALADAANATREVITGMNSELAAGALVASEEIGLLQMRLSQLQADRDFLVAGAVGTGRTADTAAIDAEIAAAQQAASAFELLRNTSELANQAFRDGATGAGQYVAQVNAIANAAAETGTLTTEQVAALANLNAELQNAAAGLGTAAGAEFDLQAALAGTNPQIDEQAGKLRGLWLAAAGALGATAALDGYEAGLGRLQDATAAWDALNALNLAPPKDFFFADFLAGAQDEIKALQEQANEPIRLNLAIDSAASQAAQKAYQDAIKAGADTTTAAAAALNVQIQTTDEINRQVEAWQAAGYSANQIASFLLPGLRQQVGATNQGLSEMERRFNEIKGAASGILSDALDPGVGVDPNAILEEMGLRPDAINENAKRLADIAKNGLTGQDWLPDFQQTAPGAWADLMLAQASGQDVRAAAAQLLLDFQDGLRPDLLDKEKAKDLVRRAITGDANMAALAAEIAAELSTEMGVSLQQAQEAANSALGVSGAEGTTGPTMTITPVIEFGEGAAEEAAKLGETIREGLAGEASLKALAQAGIDAARTWGGAFLNAVGEAVPPELIDMLTSLITPRVQSALAGAATQTGAQ